MTYMLDTNIVSFAFRARPPAVLERLKAARPDSVCVSSITLSELRYGAARSQARQRYTRLIDAFVDRVEPLPFDRSAADRYGELRAELEAKGTPIGALDMLIAAHALASGRVLVTNNVREFSRVDGLVVEDWTVGF